MFHLHDSRQGAGERGEKGMAAKLLQEPTRGALHQPRHAGSVHPTRHWHRSPAGIYISDSQCQPAFMSSMDRNAPVTDHRGLSFCVNKSKNS